MAILQELKHSENLIEDLRTIGRKKGLTAYFFNNDIYDELIEKSVVSKRNGKIVSIKQEMQIFCEDDGKIYIGYNVLDESLVVVCRHISKELYLLEEIRYINSFYSIDIDYALNPIIKFIALKKLERR